MFGGTASATGGKFVMPLLTPWSVWQGEGIMAAPNFGERRGGLWDASKLKNNLVIEVQFASRGDATSDASSTFTTASDLGNMTLYWEEVVGSKATLDAVRSEIPSDFCDNVAVSDAAPSNAPA